jgi:hypothetical protein
MKNKTTARASYAQSVPRKAQGGHFLSGLKLKDGTPPPVDKAHRPIRFIIYIIGNQSTSNI